MFFLVEFSDHSKGVYHSKFVLNSTENKCIIKHKGTKYEAFILASNDSRKYLENKKNIIGKETEIKGDTSLDSIDKNVPSVDYMEHFDNQQELFNYQREDEVNEDINNNDDSGTNRKNIPTTQENLDPYSDSEGDSDILRDAVTLRRVSGNFGKRHCCLYCGKTYAKLARHLVNVHSKEPEVIRFSSLPPQNRQRLQLIANIRKAGDFKFNSSISSVDNETMPITCRRPQKYKEILPSQYRPCPTCKGFYSRFALRMHVKKCSPNNSTHIGRNLQGMSRSLLTIDVHPSATETLRKCVLNRLNNDVVGTLLRQDELIVIYGNRLCRKYRRHHYQNYQMIRNRLRTIARFVIAIRELNPRITCLKEALTLQNVDIIIQAVERVANMSEDGSKFNSSSTAYALTNQLKYVTNLLGAEYTKQKDSTNAELTFSLCKILDMEFSESINATVKETQHEMKRQKNVILPETVHIKQFFEYLKRKVFHYYVLVKKNFCVDYWRQLASYTLVSLQVFNRKRTGEVQNMTIDDFTSFKRVHKSADAALFNSLTEEEKRLVKKYVQVSIRSKRGLRTDGTPILLNNIHFNAVQEIISLRNKAGVSPENKFVFGVPGNENFITFNACDLMRKFSKESNVRNNHLLRGNQLRKHLATSVSIKGYDGLTKDRLSDFMAHSKIVHKNFYELPHQVTNITKISTLLEEAAGKDDTVEEYFEMAGDIHHPQCPTSNSTQDNAENTQTSDSTQDNTEQCPTSNSKQDDTENRKLSMGFDRNQESEDESARSTDYEGNSTDSEVIDKKISKGRVGPRSSWTTPEKKVVRERYSNAIATGILPSVQECRTLIKKKTELQNRKPQQIKTWIRHQHLLLSKTNIKKRTWATPEKHLVRDSFKEHFRRQSLPSIGECEQLKNNNPQVLRYRSGAMIKAFFVHDSAKKRLRYE